MRYPRRVKYKRGNYIRGIPRMSGGLVCVFLVSAVFYFSALGALALLGFNIFDAFRDGFLSRLAPGEQIFNVRESCAEARKIGVRVCGIPVRL